MDTWLTRCKRRARCNCGCMEMIAAGDYMLVTRSWNRRGWKTDKCWNPDHWLKQAKSVIDSRVVIERRGRHKSLLEPEIREKRRKVQMRRASVVQRIRAEVDGGSPNVDRVIRLGGLLNKCKEEIEELGGVPKKW